jgi:hypothetical protein
MDGKRQKGKMSKGKNIENKNVEKKNMRWRRTCKIEGEGEGDLYFSILSFSAFMWQASLGFSWDWNGNFLIFLVRKKENKWIMFLTCKEELMILAINLNSAMLEIEKYLCCNKIWLKNESFFLFIFLIDG